MYTFPSTDHNFFFPSTADTSTSPHSEGPGFAANMRLALEHLSRYPDNSRFFNGKSLIYTRDPERPWEWLPAASDK